MKTQPMLRRDWLKLSSIPTLAGSSWLPALANEGTRDAQRQRAVIMLWLTGGPATIDLWDLKPEHANGGPFRPIETSVPGIQISEHLPEIARRMDDVAIIRSVSSAEGDHTRALHLLRTGYVPQGAIRFPALGALVAHERLDDQLDLPPFVSIAPTSQLAEVGNGFLSPRFTPLAISPPENNQGDLSVPGLRPSEQLAASIIERRLDLLRQFDGGFAADRGSLVVDSLKSASDLAVRIMRPEAASAFRLDEESNTLREQYGRNPFGQGCLLSRRLVERGVPFVEVCLNGWDTHQNNFDQVRQLSKRLDTACAALLDDLRERGLLESTLVVCQGEFGRTPKINRNNGRDHWPASWGAVLAGGGISGGQVVGKTSADGTEVTDRKVSVPDLVATVCRAIGIDPRKQNMSNVQRPIRVADPDARPIEELL